MVSADLASLANAPRVIECELPAPPPHWALRLARKGVVAGAAAITLLFASLIVGPKALGLQTMIVLSGSMEPTLPVGSLIVARPLRAELLQLGDIIVFSRPDRPGELVTHRIVDVEADTFNRNFITKGDANGVADPWRIPERGQGLVVVFAIPFAGVMLSIVQSPFFRLGLVAVPVMAFGAFALWWIWRPRNPDETTG